MQAPVQRARLALCALDRVVSQNRLLLVISAIAIAVLRRSWEHSSQQIQAPPPEPVSNSEVVSLEPLSRSQVLLSQRREAKNGGRPPAATLRKEVSAEPVVARKIATDSDRSVDVLKRAIEGNPSPEESFELHHALAKIYSARLRFDDAAQALSSLNATSSQAHALELSRLELHLNHHRYHMLQLPPELEPLPAPLAALHGWAALLRGEVSLAISLQDSAIEALGGFGGGCEPISDDLDSTRALALSTLSLIKSMDSVTAASSSVLQATPSPEVLRGCATHLLMMMDEESVGVLEEHAQRALGLAHLAAGSAEFAQDWHLHHKGHDCHLGSSLPRCSHSALHLALTNFALEQEDEAQARLRLLLDPSLQQQTRSSSTYNSDSNSNSNADPEESNANANNNNNNADSDADDDNDNDGERTTRNSEHAIARSPAADSRGAGGERALWLIHFSRAHQWAPGGQALEHAVKNLLKPRSVDLHLEN